MEPPTFERQLEALINRNSIENRSNTPDFILAAVAAACLDAFDQGVKRREDWYGKHHVPGQSAEWTPAETLFAFMGWLTSRDEVTTLSARHHAGPAVELITEFCKTNGLSTDCREGWDKVIKHA